MSAVFTTVAHAGIVVDYKFDGDILDYSGRNNHGTIHGSPQFLASPNGQALEFNNPSGFVQAGQYVSIPNSADILGLANSSLSFLILYRSIDGGQQNGRLFGGGMEFSQITYDYNATGFANAYSRLDDTLGMTIINRDAAESNPAAYTTDGNWHWGIGVLDRGAKEYRQYVDKVLVTTTSYSDFGTIAINNLWIGAISNQSSYGARHTSVDRFQLYDYALTQQDIDSVVDTGVVPEPKTFVVMGLLLVGMAWSMLRK